MHLTEWVESCPVDDRMYWKGSATNQVARFFEMAAILGGDPLVISTHRSKSISLPVVQVTTPYRLCVTVRDNFHDVKVSVEAPTPLTDNLLGFLAGGDSYLHPVYFEGFPRELIYEPFVPGATKFSVCTSSGILLSLARILRWQFDGKDPAILDEDPVYDFKTTREKREAASASFPVLYNPDTTTTRTLQFIGTPTDIEPDMEKLREALTQQGANYDGGFNEKPMPYLNLDFSGGLPKPVDTWLKTLNTLVVERRTDPKVKRLGDDVGAQVNVYRLTPELRARAEALGCFELLKPNTR